jgi:DNA-binding response OmpR family regulator
MSTSTVQLVEGREEQGPGVVPVRARGGPIALVISESSNTVSEVILQLLVAQGFSAVERGPTNVLATIDRFRPGLIVAVLNPRLAKDALMVRAAARSDAFVLVVAPSKDCWTEALQAGADACLPETDVHLLETQISAMRRRMDSGLGARDGADTMFLGPFLISRETHKVFVRGLELSVTKTEFLVLEHLVENAGRVVSDAELFMHVSGGRARNSGDGSATIKQYVYRLRRKFLAHAPQANLIANVRGFGYMVDRNLVTFQP